MRLLFYIILIVGLLLLWGCTGEQGADSDPVVDDTPPVVDKQIDQEKLSEIRIMEQAINAKDSSLCQGILDDGLKVGCFDRVTKVKAIEERNLPACDSIENSGIKNDCKNLVTIALQNQAAAGGGTSAPTTGTDCAQFTNPAEVQNCENINLGNLAFEQKDPSLCGRITDQELQDNCKNNVYLNLAIRDRDLTMCSQISLPARVESCQNDVYSNKAVSENDASLCDRITDEAMKQRCRTRLA